MNTQRTQRILLSSLRRPRQAFAAWLVAAAVCCWTTQTQAQTTQIKAANATALSTGSSWSSGTAPGSGDIAEWNSTATATGDTITSLGGALSIGEIQIASTVVGAVSITDATAADTLTLNGATGTALGLDLSQAKQNLTLGVPLVLGASQTWNIASGRTVNYTGVNAPALGSHVLTITGGGTVFYEPTTPLTTAPVATLGAGIVINGSTLSVDIQKTASSPIVNYLGSTNLTLTMTPSSTTFSYFNLGEVGTSGNHQQTFSSLTLNPGSSIFNQYTGRGSTSGNSVGFDQINRNAGSIADFMAAGFSSGANFGGSANCYALPGSAVSGYATLGANDWAMPKGPAAYTIASGYINDTWTAGTNITVTISSAPASGSTINTLRFGAALSPTLTLSGANIISSGGILLNSTFAANVATLTGGTLTSGNANADGTSDLIVINNSASSGSIVFNTVIADNGATSVGLTVGTTSATAPSSSGAFTLNAANTFSGSTFITKGSLLLNNSLALQNSTFNTSLPGTLNFGTLTSATFGGLAGSGTLALPASFALTVGNNNKNTTLSGAIGGNGATVTKTGTGSLTLNGANTYTGNTTISAGTLALGASGSLLGSASISSGAVLDVSAAGNYSLASVITGAGSINGSVTLATGGQLAATGTSGTLVLSNNLTLNGGTVLVNFNGSSQHGLITLGGNLTLTSGIIQVNNTGSALPNGTYKLVGVPNGTITGLGSVLSVSGFDQSGQAASVVANSGELDLVLATYVSQNLIWVGDGSGAGLWNINSDNDWTDNASKSVFHNNDFTTFDDTSANPTVNLVGTLSPLSVTVNSANNSYVFSGTGSIGGSAALADNNSGTLTVLTVNSYSGGTTIASGATVNVGNGTTAGSLGSGPIVDNSSLTYDLPAGSQTQGAISGSGTLNLTGPGTVVSDGANTLSGTTTIASGTLKQSAANALPSAGPIVVNATLDLGGLNGTVSSLTGSGIVNNTLSASPVLTVTGGGTFAGLIENTAGSLGLNVNGSGTTLLLSGINTYTGGSTVTAGTLQLGGTNALGVGSLNVASAGLVDLNGFGPFIDALTGSGTVDDASAGGTPILVIGNNGGSGTFSGTIENSSGTISLIKNGAGTETFTGNNTYAGSTTCNAGTFEIATGGTISTTTIGGQGYLVDGGTLNVSGSPTLADAGNALLESSGNVNITGTLYTTTTGDGALYKITGGTFNAGAVSLSRTWGNSTTFPTLAALLAAPTNSGFVVFGPTANATLGTLTIGLANANSDASGYLGAGTLTVSGELLVGNVSGGRWNVFQVNGGFLNASDTANGIVISPNNGGNTVNSELCFTGPSTNVVGRIAYGASTDTLGGWGWLFVNGGASVYLGNGGIVMANTHGFAETNVLVSGLLGASDNWSSSLPFYMAGTNFTLQPSDPSGNAYSISLSGTLILATTNRSALTISGLPGGSAGTVFLSAANQYNGGTLVTNNATLDINGIYALGGANYLGLTLSGGTLQYTNLNYPANGTYDLTTGSNGLTLGSLGGIIDVNGNAVSYANPFGSLGSGGLTVISTVTNGVLTLLTNNTYTGPTVIGSSTTSTVGNGKLSVLNTTGSATGSGHVTVAYGGTLTGTGILSGPVEIQSGATLAAGNNGLGTLTLGSLALDSGAIAIASLGGSPANLTLVSNSGGFAINDSSDNMAFYVYAAGGTAPWTTPGTYKLIQFSGTAPSLDASWTTVSGTNPHVANPQASSVYSFAISGGYLTLTIAGNGTSVAGTWINTGSGNWSTAANWSSSPSLPHSAGDTATFGDATGLSTVTLNAAETVGNLTFNNNNSYVIANAGHSLTLDNTGSGAALYVTAGTANSITAPVALNDNLTVNVSGGQSLAVPAVISSIPNANLNNGTEILTVNGSGTLALSGNNTYGPAPGTIGTVIGGGTVQVANNYALSLGDVSFTASSTLQAATANLLISNNLAVPASVTVTLNNGGQSLVLGGLISGSGGVSVTGTGTVAIANNNTYSGNTTVAAGVLSLNSSANLSGSQSINLQGGDLLGAGTTAFTVSQNINVGPVSGTTGGTALLDAVTGQQFTLGGNLVSAGNTGTNNLIVNSGLGNTGTVILSGANTFNGTTVISNGVLDLQNTAALQDSTLNYNNQGGTLIFDNLSTATLGGLTGSESLGLINLQGGALTLTIGNNSISNNYTGNLDDGGLGGALTKVGSATQTLSGNNSLIGTVSVSAGTLEIPTGGYLFAGGYLGGAGFLVDGGTLINSNLSTTFGTGSAIVETAGTINAPAATFVSNKNDGTLFAIYGGYFSAGTISLQRTASFTTIPTATAPVAGSTTSGFYVDQTNAAAPAVVNLSYLTLGTENSSASFREDAGAVVVTNEVLVGHQTGTENRWDILQVNGGTFTSLDTANGIMLGEMNTANYNNGELYLSGGTTYAELISLGASSDTNGGSGDVIIDGGSLYLGSLGFNNADVSGTYNYLIAFTSGLFGVLGDLTITNNIQLSGTGSNFVIQAADNNSVAHDLSITGTFSGSGNLTKTGGGTLTLNNSADYWTGYTIVSNGTLALIGTTSLSSNATIAPYAPGIIDVSGRSDDTLSVGTTTLIQTLNGNGTINGKLVVGAHGIVQPSLTNGNTAALTVSGSVTLGGATVLNLNRANTPNSDNLVAPSIAAGGTLTVNATTNLGSALVAGDTFHLFSTAVSGAFTAVNLPTNDPVNNVHYTWNNRLTTDGTIVLLTAAPNVNLNPTNLTAVVTNSGTTLALSWPADHTGWRLVMETNSLANGLVNNTNDWTTVAGSTSMNATNITINPAVPTVFYRLVYP